MSATIDLSTLNPLAKEAAELQLMAEQDDQKQKIWEKMGNYLESQNYPKDQIAKKLTELIEKNLKKLYKAKGLPEAEAKFKSGHFHNVMKQHCWTDQSFNHSKGEDVTEQGQEISSHEPKLSRDSICFAERYDDILLIYKIKKFLEQCAEELETEVDIIKNEDSGAEEIHKRDWLAYYNQEGRKEYHNFVKNLFANYFEEWSRNLDKRQALLPKMKILIASVMGSGVLISDFCSNYFALVKNKTQISPKAYRKFISEVSSYDDYIKFVQQDAWKWSILPIACPQCNKYALRTQMYHNGTWDFICTNKKGHKNESQPHFSPNLFRKVLERYEKNADGIGTAFALEQGIKIKENNPILRT